MAPLEGSGQASTHTWKRMRLLLLQLSDIHIKSTGDWIFGRSQRIADAVRDLDHEFDLCLIALTGDVAFSGLPEQYLAAEHWIADLRRFVHEALRGRVQVQVVAIPGNHDLDLQSPSPARSTMIESMVRDAAVAADPGASLVCLGPQDAFFAFRERIASVGLTSQDKVYYEYRFDVPTTIEAGLASEDDTAETVLVRCCNTAWVSQNPETPAKLVYPDGLIRTENSDCSDVVVISLLHHPYNWLEPMNGRAVRRALQNVSDVILTGHEHALGVRQQQDEVGGNSLYVEGLALQGHGYPIVSEFHAIVVDTDRGERRVVSYRWRESRYEDERTPASAWAPFTANPLRAGHAFPVSERMRAILSDPGVTLAHPTRGRISLDEIFVYPDLMEVKYESGSRSGRVVPGEQILSSAVSAERLLITGTDDSGKSTLAKRLFLDALDVGLVPILLDGRKVRLRGEERDRRELATVFEDQYDAAGDDFLDLPRERRVVLLDDFAELRSGERPGVEVLDYLCHFAGIVVLFAHDVAQQVLEIAGGASVASGRQPFTHYRLLPVSHVRREEMIGRYVALAGGRNHDGDEHLRVEMRRLLALAIGKYYAPPVPISVVSILQARAFNENLNLSQATHGYYYELLIKRALLSCTSQQELDVRLGYLTELAYAAYKSNVSDGWSETWIMTFHKRFVEERFLNFRFRDAVDTLVEAGILNPTRDGYAFRYKYIYYYFVSRALADRLTTNEGKTEIGELTARLDEQDPANILLFLTHHSKDPAIVDPMLQHADSLFAGVARADLKPDSAPLRGFETALRNAAYQDGPIDESRQRLLAQRDDLEQARESVEIEGLLREERDSDMREVQSFVGRIYVSLRTMQILGQLLKNFPGTLGGDQKERLARAVYGVALRTLGAVQELFRAHPEDYVDMLIEALRAEDGDLSKVDLANAARLTLQEQWFRMALGVTQRTAADVGNPILDPVFEHIENTDPVPVIQLISSAIRLDRAGRFPEQRVQQLAVHFKSNPLALGILRSLVVKHFHLFDVERTTKQRICAMLDIKYLPSAPRSRRRLISGEPRGGGTRP